VASHAFNGSLPILVADLADEGARDFLQGVALAEQVAFVPLLVPPVDRSPHALEVYSPDSAEPLRLLAEPVGPPTHEGFPLRLRLWKQESAAAIRAAPKRPTALRARHETSHELTERHTADLGGEVPSRRRDLVGRALANGKLQIESFIGGGGVGAVYRAQHRELRMPVAVKVLHEAWQADVDFGRRFHAEALAASRLDHPNITRVLDFGQEPDGLLYLVMEYLDGVGLRTILEREGRFGTERVVRIVSQVCAALAHAHARNVIHKDVKPENLVIVQGSDDEGDPMEVVKVCDFGIAQAPHLGTDTGPRRFQGTPEYMSPEQCQSLELDARSDVYSVGVVMYELVTGDVPFTGDDVGSIVAAHLRQAPEPPSSRVRGVDPRLEAIIMRALAKDRAHRFPTMRDLRAALRDLLDKPPVSLSGQFQRVVVPSLPVNPPRSTPQPFSSPAPSGIDDGWLIPGGRYAHIELDRPDSSRTSELMTDPSAFMRRLVNTTDPRAFAELVQPLEAAIHTLVETMQVETLWRLASTLDILATEGPELPGSRAAASRALLRVIRGPSVLAPVAHRVLTTGDQTGIRLLVAAGAFGAHALYSARVRCGEPEARTRFIRGLEAIGTAALPILRGGLERLADRLVAPGAIEIAEDLLAALPEVHDDALGAIVARYARSTEPRLARAAVAALPSLWRERSRAIVLGLVEHPSEDVAVAAMGALAQLGISDEHTPRRLAIILDRAQRGSLRVAAARALAKSHGEARRIATALLEARLRQASYPTTGGGDVLLALARAFVTVAPDRAAAERLVQEVAKNWPPELRQSSVLGPPSG